MLMQIADKTLGIQENITLKSKLDNLFSNLRDGV